MDAFTDSETHQQIQVFDAYGLLRETDQVHFDAALGDIPARLVTELVEGKSAVQFAVDARQNVAIEGGRNADGIVVGGNQDGRILAQVDPGEQLVTRSHGGMQALQKVHRIGALEVADVGAQPENQSRRPPFGLEEIQAIVILTGDGKDLEIGVVLDECQRTLLENGTGDVDGDKAQLPMSAQQGLNDETRLAGRTGTQFDEIDGVSHVSDEIVGMFLENGALRAGRVVLGQVTDLLEQVGSGLVVEVQTGEPLAWRSEADANIGREIRTWTTLWRGDKGQTVGRGGNFVEIGNLSLPPVCS